jgi:hypothetical protein
LFDGALPFVDAGGCDWFSHFIARHMGSHELGRSKLSVVGCSLGCSEMAITGVRAMLGKRQTHLAAILAVTLMSSPSAVADTLTIPNTFTPGVTISSSQVNGNFTAISSLVNGNITNSNIKAGAGISPSKLDFTAQIGPILRTAANACFAAGTTGDTQPRWQVTSDGYIKFGAGSASALDMLLKRSNSTTLAIRNADDNADRHLTVGNLTASGSIDGGSTLVVTGSARAASLILRNTNNLTFTPGAVAADRAIDINDPGAAAKLPLSTNAGTAGQVFVANGTGANGAFQDASAVTTQFGGNGSDGAVVLNSSGTGDLMRSYNGTNITFGGNVTASHTQINATGTVTFGTGTIQTQNRGYGGGPALATASKSGAAGFGPAPGQGGAVGTIGGGGGGAGAGGSGGDGGACVAGAANEGNGGDIPSVVSFDGSGGGTGAAGAGGQGGAGGYGAGTVRVCARGAINLGSAVGRAILLSAQAGSPATVLGGGGGGGGAGSAFLYSQDSISTNTADIDALGGDGGAGAGAGGDGGGGGGGGFVLRMSPSNGALPVNVTGGLGGSGTISGSAGTDGTSVSITGTPALPVIGYHADGRGLRAQVNICKARRLLCNQDMMHIEMTHRENATYLAAWYAKPGQFDNLCMALMHGGAEETAKYACVDVSQAFKQCDIHGELPVDERPATAIGDFGLLADRV